jgi:PAP2 superfamily
MRLCPVHAPSDVGGLELGRRAARRLTGPGRLELAFFVGAYLLYDAARWAFASSLPLARAHAHEIIDLERTLHLAVEGNVQRALGWGVASWLLSNVYLAAQLIVLPASLIWLYRRSRPVYRALRNTVIATWLIAVPIFALFPVAPPRLAGIGLADTVSEQAASVMTGHSTIFYNPYAAVPSLHVGFAFAIGIAVSAALHARWAKVLALAWGPLVTLAVVATANHYVFDVAAGLAVTVAGLAAGRLVARASRRPRLPALHSSIPVLEGDAR